MDPQMMEQMQRMQEFGSSGLGAGMIAFMIVLFGAIWIFGAYCLARLARNVGMPFKESFVWGLIPIANAFLLLKIAAKPYWWLILFLVPFVNVIFSVLVWMAVAERMGRPGWWGIMIALVPFANIVFMFMLVFGKPLPPRATA